MAKFIELTGIWEGKHFKVFGNVEQIERVSESGEYAHISGWGNNGGVTVKESYEEVIKLIEEANKQTP
jgi:hypothetical protein